MRTLVFVVGVAGSGKSTIGKKIAKRLHFVYLDKDTIAQPFVEALNPIKNDRESAFYLNKIRPLEYQVLLDVVEENITLGQSVVVSAPFGEEVLDSEWIEREIFYRRQLKVQVKIIWVKVDPYTEFKRLSIRKEARDQWKLDHWAQYQQQRSTFEVKWSRDPAIFFEFDNRIQVEKDFEQQFSLLIAWIAEAN